MMLMNTIPGNKLEFEVYIEKALWDTVGKKDGYDAEEVLLAFSKSNYADRPEFIPWAMCLFASEETFLKYYSPVFTKDIFLAMKREMANPVSHYPTQEQLRNEENEFQESNAGFFARMLKGFFR